MTEYVPVMVIAILTSVAIMLVASKGIDRFVNDHPSVKMLALAFLLLIGVTLLAKSFGEKIPKGYVCAAMAFSVFGEVLNSREDEEPVHLHEKISPPPDSEYGRANS